VVDGPAGLSVDAASGTVSWTPTPRAAGTQSVVLRLTDGPSQVEQRFTLEVSCTQEIDLQTGCSCGSAPVGLGGLVLLLGLRRRVRPRQ
jgi:hypothetical protein